MVVRSICGRSPLRKLTTPTRSFHFNIAQGPQNLAEWFTERFSAKPDSINNIMNLIYTQAPQNSVTPFNLFCRSAMERWTIKGLRIGTKDKPQCRSVVLASGLQGCERMPIGVALYVAAALSRRPIPGAEVTIFPVLKPKEFELQWHNEQTSDARALSGIPHHFSNDAIKLSLDEHERGVEGPLRSYVMKRGTSFVDVVMDMNNSSSFLQLKQNSLARPLRHAKMLLQDFPSNTHFPQPKFALDGEQSLFEQVVNPPTIILELRDRNNVLEEDQIVPCAEEVLTTIYKLIAETEGTRAL